MRIHLVTLFVLCFLLNASSIAAPIHKFAKCGLIDEVEGELNNWVDVNMRDKQGRTPLHWAALNGHLDIVQMLLERKARSDLEDNRGNTPLDLARRRPRNLEVRYALHDPRVLKFSIGPAAVFVPPHGQEPPVENAADQYSSEEDEFGPSCPRPLPPVEHPANPMLERFGLKFVYGNW